ncbi:MAG: DUF4296 domain-containing protein [Prolixibacteraceae bacterium]|nr:DUF4296 domain-containing protein [Prolixibacteraceae bacterium]
MKKILVLLSILLLIFSCKRDPIPHDAIPRDKYVDVLVDVHIAEGMYNDRVRLKIDSVESTSLYMSVLEKHKVTEEEMLSTSLYYSRKQREYTKIYNDVLDKISMLIEDEKIKEELIIEEKKKTEKHSKERID